MRSWARPRRSSRPSATSMPGRPGVRVRLRSHLRRRRREPPDARTRRAGHSRRMRSRSSPRTSWWARFGPRRPLCLFGHRLQPRVRAPARAVRHPQDHPRGGGDRAGVARRAVARRAGCRARLVVRGRHRARRMADAPAGASGGLRAGQRGAAHGRRAGQTAFACVDLDAERYVRVDQRSCAPPSPPPSVGDPAKARGSWAGSRGLVRRAGERMVEADLRSLEAIAAGS